MAKYIFITGGVASSLGKGIAAASLGLLLKERGFRVVNQKFDPYLNIDPGNMNPFQHGEVFVTEDGAAADLDLGHYERFTDESTTQNSNTTAGRVYLSVLERERKGGYDGGTVQVIPSITDEIRNRIMQPSRETDAEIIITEIGGTVGDIESLPFIEAILQTRNTVGSENCAFIHLTLVPYLKNAGELKTKPTQHSVKEIQGLGIQPDIVMIRSQLPLDSHSKDKIALYCNIPSDAVIQNLDAKSIYEVPLMMEKEGLGRIVCRVLALPDKEPDLSGWQEIVRRFHNPQKEVKIALVGHFVELPDAYRSVIESLTHGGITNCTRVTIDYVDSTELTDYAAASARLSGCNGVIIPGGSSNKGIEELLFAIRYAREQQIPYFGICLGMQAAAVEYARNVLGLEGANTTEADNKTSRPVVALLPNRDKSYPRVGKYDCALVPGSLIEKTYGTASISERHRHCYGFNNEYSEVFTKSAFKPVGICPEDNLVEAMELEGHPWMVCVQFRPEFKSRPNRAHPLFRDFIAAAAAHGAEV
ncbi:MAG: CTP synthase [Spirochaetaceae bacterium]|jgi:CTP synthase|nr:CTP synthase [Spirochaetaceae bacterium]